MSITPITPTTSLLAKAKARRASLLLSAAGLALCLTVTDAQARNPDAQARNPKAKPSTSQARAKPSVKVKHQRSPSEESSAERERRLYRECQGRPNAGACLGYTRKP